MLISGPGRLLVAGTVFFLLSSSLTAAAQSRALYMPVLESTDSADSKLTLANPSLEPATVTLTARSYTGATLQRPGIINPVSMTLPPSSSRALRAREIFGAGISSGWAELQTASPAVSGAFFLSDSKQTSMDGAELNSAPASRLIFPKATTGILSANRLTIINTSDQAITRGSVLLFENSGRLVAQRDIALPAFAGFSGMVPDLAAGLQSFEGYVVVDSNSTAGALIGFESYRGVRDIAVLAAIPDTARLRTGFLPQFANRAGYISTLVLVNYAGGMQTITARAAITDVNSNQGANTSLITVQRALAAYERLEVRLDQLFGFNVDAAIASYVRFENLGAVNDPAYSKRRRQTAR